MDLREKIHNEFPKEGAPAYRLSDAIKDDDYGDTTYTFEETWETWEQITDWQVVKSEVFFSFAPKNAAIYVLPRFMLFVLDEIEGILPQEYQSFGAGDAAVWFIESLKRKNYRNSGLSDSQISVIEQFLSLVYQDYDYSVTVTIDVAKEKP